MVVVVLPVLLAVVVAVVWSPLSLLFGLAAPVMALATAWGERRAARRRHRRGQLARGAAVGRQRNGSQAARLSGR